MGKVLTRPEFQGGFTIGGTEIFDTNGAFKGESEAPNGTVVNYLDFSGITPSTNTDGTIMTTKSTWVNFSTAAQTGMKLLLSTSATTGDFATMRMRARADAAGNAICGNFSASAGANNHGDLFAVQGYAQPNAYTNNSASNIVCGLYSCIDAGGVSSGRRWSTWIDEHSTTKASGGHYMCRISMNGTVAIDGCFTIYSGGRLPALFNFEDVVTPGAPLYDTDQSLVTQSGAIKVITPGGTKYIPLYDHP